MRFNSYNFNAKNESIERYKLLLKANSAPLRFVKLVQNMESYYESNGFGSIDKYFNDIEDEPCRLNNFEQMNVLVDSYLTEITRIRKLEDKRSEEKTRAFIKQMKMNSSELLYGSWMSNMSGYFTDVPLTPDRLETTQTINRGTSIHNQASAIIDYGRNLHNHIDNSGEINRTLPPNRLSTIDDFDRYFNPED